MSLSFGIGDLFHAGRWLGRTVADAFAFLGDAVAANPAYLLGTGIAIVLLAATLLRVR
jgi:hypothetical protein